MLKLFLASSSLSFLEEKIIGGQSLELKEMNCSNDIQMHFWLLQLSSQSTLLVHNSLKTHKSPQVIRLISLTRCCISTEQYASWSLLRESSKIFLHKARDCIRECTFMLVENACCRFLLPDFRSQLQYVSCSLLIESSKNLSSEA